MGKTCHFLKNSLYNLETFLVIKNNDKLRKILLKLRYFSDMFWDIPRIY